MGRHANLQQRQHGIASYNKGCRCELCRTAVRVRARRLRRQKRRDHPGPYFCVMCDGGFATEAGLHIHEWHCTG